MLKEVEAEIHQFNNERVIYICMYVCMYICCMLNLRRVTDFTNSFLCNYIQ